MPNKWNFQSVQGGKVYGINESGIEIFKGTPYKSLAREICQNALDAMDDSGVAVELTFKAFDLPVGEFPDGVNFRKALGLIRDFYRERPIPKVINFLDRADELFSNDTIRCLRISDTNTTGLVGSAEPNNHFTPWNNLVKSSGVSDERDSAGGSFGIGKSAPFACSELRTVIYSTRDMDSHSATQGVSRLISYKTPEGEIATGEGYFCDADSNAPIYKLISYDREYSRSAVGTDIFILAFDGDENWEREVIMSVIDSFMLAIIENRLVLKVGDRTVKSENLESYIDKYAQEMPYTKNYYEVLTSPDAKVFEDFPIEYCDEVELRVLVKSGFHGKAAYFRSCGMKILERGYISSFLPFAAVLTLRGDVINKYFKDMESVSHDKWEPSRIEGINNRRRAEYNLKELYRYVRDKVCSLEVDSDINQLEAEGVGEYLPDELPDDSEESRDDTSEIISEKSKPLMIDVVKKPLKQSGFQSDKDDFESIAEKDLGELEELDEENYGEKATRENNSTPGGGTRGGRDDIGETPEDTLRKKKYTRIKPINLRLFCTDVVNGKYILTFSLDRTISEGYIDLRVSGEQGKNPAVLSGAHSVGEGHKTFDCIQNKIFVDNIAAREKVRISFITTVGGYYAMEVFFYGNQV